MGGRERDLLDLLRLLHPKGRPHLLISGLVSTISTPRGKSEKRGCPPFPFPRSCGGNIDQVARVGVGTGERCRAVRATLDEPDGSSGAIPGEGGAADMPRPNFSNF
jgi:hypothetical protein